MPVKFFNAPERAFAYKPGEGVVDETHLQVWKGIREQQIQVLQCEDLGISSRQRCLDHLRASEKVLNDLGESITPYTPSSSLLNKNYPNGYSYKRKNKKST
jgi:hypothetical protein